VAQFGSATALGAEGRRFKSCHSDFSLRYLRGFNFLNNFLIMEIEIYSRDGCPYCDMIREVVSRKGWSYKERKLYEDFTREEFVGMFGEGSTFPRVLINNKLIGGATESVQYLREQNLL